MIFPEFWDNFKSFSNNISFSCELILHLHGSGDGGGGVYGGGDGWVFPGVVSACFLYYQLINLRK